MRAFTTIAALAAAAVPTALAKLEYFGVAMSGIDWGCDIDGTCPVSGIQVPLASEGGADSAAQMKHFIKDDGMNMFRIPVSWQFLTGGQPTAKFDEINFNNFDKLMQACTDTGSYCMIDLHNFARFNGSIIGQGGPDDDALVDLWSNIAEKYKKNDRIVYGIMNEPHDLDIKLWATTVQKTVTGIRKAGALDNIILLPGDNFTNAETFVSTNSADLLNEIKNPDGTKDNLVMDIHRYLDINNSGQHQECTTDNVEAFKTVAKWLRKNNRKAIVSETGASMDPTCMTRFCAQNKYLSENTDVFIGFVAWAAGGFDDSYVLSLTPEQNKDGSWTDNKLMKQCILEPFDKGERPTNTATASVSTPSTTSTDSVFHENTSKPEPTDNAAAITPVSGSGILLGAAAFLFAML